MKVLVCGSRHFNDYELMREKLNAYSITSIIHGAARGADTLAGRYGKEMGKPVSEFPAKWDTFGRSAGPIRNSQMLQEGLPEMVIAFRGPNSRGTQNMIDQSKKAGVPVCIVDIP
jgi:hypothetical protein